jgi:four helix bundle protein
LWQKAQELALAVIRVVAGLPRDNAAQIIGRQLVASAGSIGANVAEGHGRFSLAAHRNHLSIAKGSACETDGWLDLLSRAGYVGADTEGKLHGDCVEIIRMLTAKILDLERRERSGKPLGVREHASVYAADDYQAISES